MRIESLSSVGDKLNSDDYTCNDVARDCPFFICNTCPLCICGLLPILVVCASAILHNDYVTHVTEFGAKLVSEMGLSYTVHYTSTCHPMVPPKDPRGDRPLQPTSLLEKRIKRPEPCNPLHGFEVSASEYDAVSGSLMRVRNITDVRARTLSAVKVTPDWRFVIFVGSVARDPHVETADLNLWVVGATQTKSKQVVPILAPNQISVLEAQCRNRAAEIFSEAVARKKQVVEEQAQEVQQEASEKTNSEELARLTAEAEEDKKIAERAAELASNAQAAAKSAEAKAAERSAEAEKEKKALAEAEAEDGVLKEKVQEEAAKEVETAAQAADLAEHSSNEKKAARQGDEQQGPSTSSDRERRHRQLLSKPVAHLVGFKNLQVILQPFVTVEHDGDIIEAPTFTKGAGEGPVYRMAMSVQCEAEMPSLEDSESSQGDDLAEPLKFSQLAVVDFELLDFNQTDAGSVRSALLPLNLTLKLPEDEVEAAEAKALSHSVKAPRSFTSQCCPRFIPSSRGSRLLFVVEHDDRASALRPSRPASPTTLQRRLAAVDVPTGEVIKSDPGLQAFWLTALTGKRAQAAPRRLQAHDAILVDVGEHSLPSAPVHGCPEFVPSLYVTPTSITDTMMAHLQRIREHLLHGKELKEKPQLEAHKLTDTFVFTSNTIGSASVLGVDAQIVAASLDGAGAKGEVSTVHPLFNVDAMPDSITSGLNMQVAPHAKLSEEQQLLRLEGCKPIRAAGRKGHMRLEWAFETLLTTFHVRSDRGGYTAWLACTTADQKVAIVQSPKRSHWVNLTMPFPVFTEDAISQTVWCARDHEDECFEVWSSPNPNEMST